MALFGKGIGISMEAVPDEFHLHCAHSLTYSVTKGIAALARCSVRSESWGSEFSQWDAYELGAAAGVKHVSSQNTATIGCSRNGGYGLTFDMLFFWGGKPPNLGVRKILAIWLMVMWGCEKWIHVIQWLGHASIRHAPVYVGSSICMERIRWESNSRSASWDSSHFVELGKFHPHIHKSLPFVHILNETKPICCTSYFCMMSSEPQRCPTGELCSVYGLMQFFFANRRATAWVIPDRERFSWNLSFLVF